MDNNVLDPINDNIGQLFNKTKDNFEDLYERNILQNFTNFDSMIKHIHALDFNSGDLVRTLGFHHAGDGGESNYIITNKTSDIVVDGISTIDIGNNLVATLNCSELNARSFGAYGDGIHDDSPSISKLINYLRTHSNTTVSKIINFPYGTYLISEPIELLGIPYSCKFQFNNSILKITSNIDYAIHLQLLSSNYWLCRRCEISNVEIRGDYKCNIGILIDYSHEFIMSSVRVHECKIGFQIDSVYYGTFSGYNISQDCLIGIKLSGDEVNTINISSIKLNSGNAYKTHQNIESDSIGILFDSISVFGIHLNGVIEGFDYGITTSVDRDSNGSVLAVLDSVYFEAISKNPILIDYDSNSHYQVWDVTMLNIRNSNTDKPYILRNGIFRLIGCQGHAEEVRDTHTRTTIIQKDYDYTKLRPAGQYNPVFVDIPQNTDIVRYGGTNIYPQEDEATALSTSLHLGSVVNHRGSPLVNRVMMSYGDQSQTFLKGASPIIQSDDGSLYKLYVTNDGVLRTTRLNTSHNTFMYPAKEHFYALRFDELWRIRFQIGTGQYSHVACQEICTIRKSRTDPHIMQGYVEYNSDNQVIIESEASNPGVIIGEITNIYNYVQTLPLAYTYSPCVIDSKSGMVMGRAGHNLVYIGNFRFYSYWTWIRKNTEIPNTCYGVLSDRPSIETIKQNNYMHFMYYATDTQKYYITNENLSDYIEFTNLLEY